MRLGINLGLTVRPLNPEKVVNGRFDTDITGWGDLGVWTGGSAVWNAGSIRVTVVSFQGAAQAITGLYVGVTYRINFDVTAVDVGKTGRIYVGNSINPGSTPVLNAEPLGVGSYSLTFVASATSHAIGLSSSDGAGFVDWDNISVRRA